jgi:DNA polymerase-3 subunit beta
MADTQATMTAEKVTFTVNGSDLFAALKAVEPVINRRNTIPILSIVRITGSAEGLAVEGTDLDVSFRYIIEGDFPAFDVAVDYFRLVAFVKILSGGMFVVKASADSFSLGGFLFATADGVAFYCLPAIDVPDAPIRNYVTEGDFNPAVFADIRPAISTEETRYYLNGVFLHSTPEGKARIVATDGHRLMARDVDSDYTGPGVIIPRRVVTQLMKLKPGKLATCHEGARFTAGPLTIWTKIIDGSFPDYDRVIPKANPIHATVARAHLLEMLRLAKAFNAGKAFEVRLKFSDDILEVQNRSTDHGRASLQVDGVELTGTSAPFEIGFNGHYVQDLLRVSKGDTITFQFEDGSSPARVDEGPLTMILMPLRV